MSVSNSRTTDEAAIRALLEDWARAVRAKDLKGILANHSQEVLMFDLPGPLESKGIDAYRRLGISSSLGRMFPWSLILMKWMLPRAMTLPMSPP
jgi:hypothetical protein